MRLYFRRPDRLIPWTHSTGSSSSPTCRPPRPALPATGQLGAGAPASGARRGDLPYRHGRHLLLRIPRWRSPRPASRRPDPVATRHPAPPAQRQPGATLRTHRRAPRQHPAVPVERPRRGALDMLCGSYRYHAGASLFGALPERLLVHMDESTQQPLRALIGLMREEAESTRSGALDHRRAGHRAARPGPRLPGPPTAGRRPVRPAGRRPPGTSPAGHAGTPGACLDPGTACPAGGDVAGQFRPRLPALGGTSPWNLLTRIRMEKARGLLRQTQKSLLDIAARDRLPVGGGVFPQFPPGLRRIARPFPPPDPLAESATGAFRRSAAMQCE